MAEARLQVVLGLDGGGSKTQAVVLNLSGQVLGEGLGGTSATLYASDEVVATSTRTALKGAFSTLTEPPQVVGIGCTFAVGGQGPVGETLAEYTPLSYIWPISECEACSYAALGKPHSLVILAGTGSFVTYCGPEGYRAHVGGGGPILGDFGSGYWIGVEALKRAFQSYQEALPPTTLVDRLCERFKLPDLGALVPLVYVSKLSRWEVASLSKLVADEADAGDELSREILVDAAGELNRQLEVVARKLEGEEPPSDIVLAGGVLQRKGLVAELVSQRAEELLPQAKVTTLELPPAAGCALSALARLDFEIDELVHQLTLASWQALKGEKGSA